MHFAEVTDWGEETWDDRDVTGVAVDSCDRVYLLRRGYSAVTVLDPDGTIVDRWGDDQFSDRPHLISIGHDDTVYVADDGGHRVYAFDTAGRLLETVGTGLPSNTGFDAERYGSTEAAFDQMGGGPPFNRPTKAVSSPAGELFVSDGYRNCRIHRFSADRQQVHSWGSPGGGEGSFVIPHSITLDQDGRVLICDRENDRIQVFSRDGDLLQVWTHVQRPTDVAVDRRGYVYVTELARGPRDMRSWRLGRPEHELPGRVTIWSPDNTMVARITTAVDLLAPHAIAVDSTGAIYVAEVPESFAKATGRPHRRHRCLHKFAAP
jgi:DNA-binding beta-propeller fold protein YncE